jgi:hypothetical protein
VAAGHRYLDLDRFERLRGEVDELRPRYASARPFPHVVLDDVLAVEDFDAAVSEFPAIDDPGWTGYLHINEMKYANARPDTWGPTLQRIATALCSDEFVELLGRLTGFQGLLADESMDGGGLHQTLRGGFLNVHTDFTTNHRVRNWRRRVNVLLYLNHAWSSEWGGSLEFWDATVSACVRSVEPWGNRMVIFTTSDDAYHGHPTPLRCPDGEARRSLALYYFTEEDRPRRRATQYRSRPRDGLKGAAIWMDRQALQAYDLIKMRFGLTDRVASRTLARAHHSIHRVSDAAEQRARRLAPHPRPDVAFEDASERVRQFFDGQGEAKSYASLKHMTKALDVAAAEVLHDWIGGDVLAVGGVWDYFDWRPSISTLTVLDLSMEMLNDYCPDGATRVASDLYTVEFPSESFDTVVFPLMLHHTPAGSWRDCEHRIRDAIGRAFRWLRPGGQVFVVEYCPHPLWYPIQRAALPLTRRFLAAYGQPLVVMYTRSFYVRVLADEFGSAAVERVDPPGFNYWTWYPVFMAVRWLKVPLALYPKLHVFRARRAGRDTDLNSAPG